MNQFIQGSSLPSSSAGGGGNRFISPGQGSGNRFLGNTNLAAPQAPVQPVQTPQASVPFAGQNIPSGVLNNPVANFIGGIGEKVAETLNKAPEFHFADSSNFFTPVGFAKSTAQGLLNTPQEAGKAAVSLGSNVAAGTSTPQQVVGDIAAAAQLPLLLLTAGLASPLKEGLVQTAKNIGTIGLKNTLKEGASETALSLAEQGVSGIAKTAAKEAVGGGAFGLLGGLQSGKNINNPTDYIKNLLLNVGVGAVSGAALSIPPLVALPLAKGMAAHEGAIFVRNAHGEPVIDHILISPEVAQHTVVANGLETEPVGKAILKDSIAAQNQGLHVSITPSDSGKFITPDGGKVDVGLATPYEPSTFSLQSKLDSSSQILRDTYSKVPQDKMDNALAKMYNEFEGSVAGSRTLIKDEQGYVTGVNGSSSTFPKWIPDSLRQKPLMDKTFGLIADGLKNFNFPPNSKYPRVNALLNAMFDHLDGETGVDTKAIRQDIINTHEQIKAGSQSKGTESPVPAENTSNQATISQESASSQPQEPISVSHEGSPEQGVTQPAPESATAGEQARPGQSEGEQPTTSAERTSVSGEPSSESSTSRTDQNSSGLLQPVGEGETKTSKLGSGVEAKAVEQRLTDSFGKLPEYKTANMADQAKQATDLLAKDRQGAIDVALGKKEPPAGMLPEAVFTAVENKALEEGSVSLLRDLANSPRVTEATAMGQRIRALAERNPESPVAAIQQVQDARAKNVEQKTGTSVAKAIEKTTQDIKSNIKPPDRNAWGKFLDSIQC